MKFRSIFARAEPDAAASAPAGSAPSNVSATLLAGDIDSISLGHRAGAGVEHPDSPAMRAVRLLGVPEAHLTPQVRAAIAALMGEVDDLRERETRLREALRSAEAAADFDTLAPVFNRRAFMREVSRVVAMVRRHEIEASLIFLDLNGFKSVNDRWGHAAGDAVLRAVGETLANQVRESDLVARLGGDEFAAVLTHLDPEAARYKAEALADAICMLKVKHGGATLTIDVSYGVSQFTPDESAEQLLARADEAMYMDKAAARGRLRFAG